MKTDPERLVVVTGLSGSGKSYVERCFEDLGFFCIDNLPLALVDPLLDELSTGETAQKRICVVADIRTPAFASRFPEAYRRIKARIPSATLVFLDASEDSLIRRFSESRRPHPIAEGKTLLEALRRERDELTEVRSLADIVVDTSALTVHELRETIARTFGSPDRGSGLQISIISFGFKFGAPYDVDLLFDVRFLANPHFVPELKPKTGEDPAVAAYIEKDGETEPFLSRLVDFVGYLLPRYGRESKSYLSIGIGCTGGKHRSVFVAERLGAALRQSGHPVRIRHRDAGRP